MIDVGFPSVRGNDAVAVLREKGKQFVRQQSESSLQ
jgi:hypothetical protein